MSDVKWTQEQLQAINEKGLNILVAAAAGSGKTAVLVERIINKIINEKVDINKILVVTFTNAAAGEMREKVLEAIYKKLEKDPTNAHIQKQITLLSKASICTIDSFCLDVIHNHFYELDLSSNFRIADTTEIDLLMQDVLEDLFEQKYIDNDKDFIDLLEMYTSYRDDETLKDLILSIYNFAQSTPFPKKWIHENVEKFNIDKNSDFIKTIWGQSIIEEIKQEIEDSIFKLKNIRNQLEKYPECEKFYNVINEDIIQIESVIEKATSWDEVYEAIHRINFIKWPVDKKVTLDIKEEAKEVRDNVKKAIKEKIQILINHNSSEIYKHFETTYLTLKKIEKIVLEFSNNFADKKREKNCIDFNDIEHFALKILLDENGEKKAVAKKYEEKFEEIAIDEYQDSNLVQESILNSISKGNNIFMVGDVKQSIYKFRQARPELFLQKYEKYKNKDELFANDINNDLKIQLFRNFRSRNNILDITNLVFEEIMSKELGDINYNENEYLNYGANYPEIENIDKSNNETSIQNIDHERITELNIIDMKENETITAIKGEEDKEETERIEDDVLEARFVANRVKELLDSNYNIYDKKVGYRHIEPKDIVILLRSTNTLATIYEKELSEIGLPVFSDSSTSYLESVEVETILSILKLINNPMQDIPLVVVLRSNIGNFTDNDLINIRLADRNCNFYEALLKARISCEKPLKEKIEKLLEKLEKWREQSEYLPLNELIWQIYLDTGYYQYVGLLPSGAIRQANLKMLFEKAKQYETASFKGLFNFIQFIEKLHKQSSDTVSAKLIGETANVIRIMSIHKSKGLEFPVVFLCNSHKKFNLKDLNDTILLHQDLGFGPTLIDINKKIKYNTVAKQAISLKVKQETLSEEERILYVALTRAKEKLIITGRSKDLQKSLQEKRKNLSIYPDTENFKIDSRLIKKCNSYLDWIEYVYIFNENKNISLKGKNLKLPEIMNLKVYSKDDLIKELKTKDEQQENNIQNIIEEKIDNDEENIEKIRNILEWKYQYEIDTKLPTKTSVSKIKQEKLNEISYFDSQNKSEENIEISENNKQLIKPENLEEENVSDITPAQRGTLIHLCIQKINEKKDYQIQDVNNLIQELVEKQIISETEADAIDKNLVYSYTQSELFKNLAQAKEIHKEQPFYINLPAKEIFEEAQKSNSEKNILVQGIIDLYYIDKNNQIHLVDFKTDYVPKGKEKEVAEKYKIQIDIYRKALEQALGKQITTAQICLANCNWKQVSI